MKEMTLIRALEMHDKAINGLRTEFKAMQRVLDKTYVQSLTHVMMWDCLLMLLHQNKLISRDGFDNALKELSDKTLVAMEAEQAKRSAEPPAVPVAG